METGRLGGEKHCNGAQMVGKEQGAGHSGGESRQPQGLQMPTVARCE